MKARRSAADRLLTALKSTFHPPYLDEAAARVGLSKAAAEQAATELLDKGLAVRRFAPRGVLIYPVET